MLPRDELGKILHDLLQRVKILEDEKTIDITKITSKDVIVTDNLKLNYLSPYNIPIIDASNIVQGYPITTLINGTPHQINVIDDGDGTIQLASPQNIDTDSNVTFGGLTVNGSTQIVPMSYTNSPIYKFEMIGSTQSETMLNVRRSDNSNTGPSILLQKSRGTPLNPQAVLTSDVLGMMYFSSYNGNSWTTPLLIYGQATEDHTQTHRGSRMDFQTTENYTPTAVTRFRIDHDGVVSVKSTINSTSPITGCFQASGGIGVYGNACIGGYTNTSLLGVNSTTESTNVDTGCVVTNGGVGIKKSLHIGYCEKIYGTLESSDAQSGALIVSGGVGIGGSMNINGPINVFSTIDSSDNLTGSVTLAGGCAINKSLNVGDKLIVYGSDMSTSTSTGSLNVHGGIGIEQLYVATDVTIGGTININNLFLSSTVNATSTSSGALQVAGGAGLNNLYVENLSVLNGNLQANSIVRLLNTTNATDITSGCLEVLGGASIIKDLHVGGIIYGNVSGSVTTDTLGLNGSIISTSTSTGTLKVVGGVGIGGDIYIGNSAIILSTLNATNTSSGALKITGGESIGKDLYVGGTIYGSLNGSITTPTLVLNGTIQATSTNGGTLRVDGGTGIGGNLFVGGELNVSGSQIFGGSMQINNNVTTNGIIKTTNTTQAVDDISGALEIAGGAGIGKDVYIGGALNVWNRILTYNNMSVYGVIESLNSDEASGLFTGALQVSGGASISKNLYVGGNINGNLTGNINTQTLYLPSAIQSTSTNSGALRVNGGVGVGGDIYAGNNIYVAGVINGNLSGNATLSSLNVISTINSTSISTGCAIFAGGIGIGQDLNIGGSTKISNTTQATNTTTGALNVIGGVSIGGNLYVDNTIYGNISTPALSLFSTINATNTNSGTLIVSGGESIAKDLYVGGTIYGNLNGSVTMPTLNLAGTIDSTDANSGTLTVKGGTGITKNLYVGDGIVSNSGKIFGKQIIGGTWWKICMLNENTNNFIKFVLTTKDINSATMCEKRFYGGAKSGTTTFDFSHSIDTGYQANQPRVVVFSGVGIKDIFMYGQSSISSLTFIFVDSANIPLIWNDEGTGTWPVSYSSGVGLYYDTNSSTNPPNTNQSVGTLTVNSTTQSISTSSGAFILSGGGCVAKDLYVGGTIYGTLNGNIITPSLTLSSTVQSNSTNSGALIVGGGVGIGKNLYVGGTLNINSDSTFTGIINANNNIIASITTQSASISSGAIRVAGGVGIAKDVYVGGALNVNGITTFGNTLNMNGNIVMGTNDIISIGDITSSGIIKSTLNVDASDTNTGSLQITGGGGIGQLVITKTYNSTSTSTGVLTMAGGVGIAKTLYVGTGMISDNGIIYGKKISGGVWWKIYTMTISTNDYLSMKSTTKNINNNVMCVKTFTAGTSSITGTASYNHAIQSGVQTYQPRFVVFNTLNETVDISQIPESAASSDSIGGFTFIAWQSFTATSNNPLSAFSHKFSTTVGNANLYISIHTGQGYNAGTQIAASNYINTGSGLAANWYKFTFTPNIMLSSGTLYTACFRSADNGGQCSNYIRYGWQGSYGGSGYYSSTMGGNFPTTSGNAQTFQAFIMHESTAKDIYIYGCTDATSTTYVAIDSSANSPAWVNEGSSTWPTSYPSGTTIAYDTNDITNYPANVNMEYGTLSLTGYATFNATSCPLGNNGGHYMLINSNNSSGYIKKYAISSKTTDNSTILIKNFPPYTPVPDYSSWYVTISGNVVNTLFGNHSAFDAYIIFRSTGGVFTIDSSTVTFKYNGIGLGASCISSNITTGVNINMTGLVGTSLTWIMDYTENIST